MRVGIKESVIATLAVGTISMAGFTLSQVIKYSPQAKADKAAIEMNSKATAEYKRKARNINSKDLASNYKGDVNVNDLKNDLTGRINDAVKAAYNERTKENTEDTKNVMLDKLGPDFGGLLAKMTNIRGGNPYSVSVEDTKIAFGKYDPSNSTIPVSVHVAYKVAKDSKDQTFDWITATYNAKDKKWTSYKVIQVPQIRPQSENKGY